MCENLIEKKIQPSNNIPQKGKIMQNQCLNIGKIKNKKKNFQTFQLSCLVMSNYLWPHGL